MSFYQNAFHAIREGNFRATSNNRTQTVIHVPGCGWMVGDPTKGFEGNGEVDLLCLGRGKLPIPVSEAGTAIARELINGDKR